MAKKVSAASKIQNLLKGGKKPTVKLDEKKQKPKGTHGGSRANTGGARENSGREPLSAVEQKRTLKGAWREFANTEVEESLDELQGITRLEKGTKEVRMKKMTRLAVIQEVIYHHGKKGNMVAAKEFNDRSLGKSPQPLIGDIEEDPIQVNHDVSPILEKAYGTDDNDEEES